MSTSTSVNSTTYKNEGRAMDRVDGEIKSAIDSAKEQTGHLLEDAKCHAESGKEYAKEKYKEVEDAVKSQSDTVVEFIKAQPVKSVLIALGVGYAISCMSKK